MRYINLHLHYITFTFRSLDFAIDRFFMKLFKTNNINTARFCQIQFECQLPSSLFRVVLIHSKIKFEVYRFGLLIYDGILLCLCVNMYVIV